MLAKSKLNGIEFLIFKPLIYSNISHNEFILINNVLKIWRRPNRPLDFAREAKVYDRATHFSLFVKQCYRIVWSVEKIQKLKTQKL